MWDTDLVSVRQGSKPCIAHAVKIVLVPVVLLRPYGSVYYWLFLFSGNAHSLLARMTLVHRLLWTAGVCRSQPRLFFCPNAGNGFEDISNYRKAGNTHECKKAKAGAYGKKEMAFGGLAASEGAQIQPSP